MNPENGDIISRQSDEVKREVSKLRESIALENNETSDLFELKIDFLLENVDENINELISFIRENHKGNEAKLREIFMTKVGDEDYELFYYNNDKLLRFLNATILFGDLDFVQSKNIGVGYEKDPKTGNFLDKQGNKILIYRNSIISTSRVIERFAGKTIKLGGRRKDYPLHNVGANTIYLTIGDKPYGEYMWDPASNMYLLQDHKDGNKPLIIEKGKQYTVTLKNRVIDGGYEKLIQKELNHEEIAKMYSQFTYTERHIEKIKKRITSHLDKLIAENGLELKTDEYIFYIDKLTQRNFLIQNAKQEGLIVIGYDKVSTGNSKRSKKYFDTPNIIINRDEPGSQIHKGDWRAEGTDSKGFGDEGSKIFYLGKYHIDKKGEAHILEGLDSNGKGYYIDASGNKIPAYVNFHFAMHKTTPRATTQLGRKLSHGCVRMTPFVIDILDKQKILDGKRGKYVIVGEYK